MITLENIVDFYPPMLHKMNMVKITLSPNRRRRKIQRSAAIGSCPMVNKYFLSSAEIAIYITAILSYSPSYIGQETMKRTCGLRVKLLTRPTVYNTRWRLHTARFNAERQAGKLCMPIFSFYFHLCRNQTGRNTNTHN